MHFDCTLTRLCNILVCGEGYRRSSHAGVRAYGPQPGVRVHQSPGARLLRLEKELSSRRALADRHRGRIDFISAVRCGLEHGKAQPGHGDASGSRLGTHVREQLERNGRVPSIWIGKLTSLHISDIDPRRVAGCREGATWSCIYIDPTESTSARVGGGGCG